jgi:hypothetical protein
MISKKKLFLAGGAMALGLAMVSQIPAVAGTKAEAPIPQ